MIAGRPFRFLLLVVSCWTLGRAAFVLPDIAGSSGVTPAVREARAPAPAPAPASASEQVDAPPLRVVLALPHADTSARFAVPKLARQRATRLDAAPRSIALAAAGGWAPSTVDRFMEAQLAFARRPARGIALAAFAAGAGFSAEEMALGSPRAHGPGDRWSGAAWALLRRDGTLPPSRASRLGGAQAGVRVDYHLSPGSGRELVLYGRMSSALYAPAAAEAALGIAGRPARGIPVSLAVERRQAVSGGGRSDFALLAYGGVSDESIGPTLRLDGYGQAGLVDFADPDAFIDGEMRIGARIRSRLHVGAGIWGGAQPGAARLDIGPQASLSIPVAGNSARIAAEWRERVAGSAQPSSGPAITIGMNF